MAVSIQDKKLSQNEVLDMISPMSLDLTAVYSILRDDINELVSRAQREHWTPDQLVDKIMELI